MFKRYQFSGGIFRISRFVIISGIKKVNTDDFFMTDWHFCARIIALCSSQNIVDHPDLLCAILGPSYGA